MFNIIVWQAFQNIFSLRSQFTNQVSETISTALLALFSEILISAFNYFPFHFISFPLSPKTSSYNNSSSVSSHQFVIKAEHWKPVKQCRVKPNVLLLLLLDIDGNATKVATGNLSWSTDHPDSGLQCTVLNHSCHSTRTGTTKTPVGPRMWMKWAPKSTTHV